MTENLFVGHHAAMPGPQRVVHIRIGHTTYACGELHHHSRHSPDGFAWGYSGSGPSDLALSMLIATLGTNAWCPACTTSPDTAPGIGWCPACNGAPFNLPVCHTCHGLRTAKDVEDNYRIVRDRIVANLPPDTWIITGRQLLHTIADAADGL